MKVLSEFYKAGGTEDILYSDSAHLGTDKLPYIIKNIRERIISLGGDFIFSAKLTDILFDSDSNVKAVAYEKDGERVELFTKDLILSIGHSARDTFYMLSELGLKMESRGFGIGMRIEHPREYIDKLVYKNHYNSDLESASYHLVTHLSCGRSVYSFCMCPGGEVVAAASEHNGIVTNGMSPFSRKRDNSNSALLVSMTPSDFGSDSPLAGFDLQKKIEEQAFIATGSSYKAPSVSLSSFMECNAAPSESVRPSYPVGTECINPDKFMPKCVTDSLRESIFDFDKWMPGFFFGDAVLTAPETRSTSPVRILRGASFESVSHGGVYPSGEGAGYSGGIVSSAVDGLRVAEAIINKYSSV
jgi:uncharacterized FAD-dependent dehydrogenase